MNLRRGQESQAVRSLKDTLTACGFVLSTNDRFDLATEAAVRTAQEMLRLEKDGIVGPRTEAQLQSRPKLLNGVNPINWVATVPYYPQRDNEYNPGGTCNVTSLAMVLAYHGVRPQVEGNQLEDELFQRLQEPDALEIFHRDYPELRRMGYKPRHVHGMLRWLAKQYGFQATFNENLSYPEMAAFGKQHGPLITSGRFTSSGHIITIVGGTLLQDLIVHDPWGNWNTGYRDHNGKYLIYNREAMADVLAGQSKQLKRAHRIWK